MVMVSRMDFFILTLCLLVVGVRGKLGAATIHLLPPPQDTLEVETKTSPECVQYCKDIWNSMAASNQKPPVNTKYACCKDNPSANDYCQCKNPSLSNSNQVKCDDVPVSERPCCKPPPGQPDLRYPCNNGNGHHLNYFCCRDVNRHLTLDDHCDGHFKDDGTGHCRQEFCRSRNGDPANEGRSCGTSGQIFCGGFCIIAVTCNECQFPDGTDKPNDTPCTFGATTGKCCRGRCIASETVCPQCISCPDDGVCCGDVCKPKGWECECPTQGALCTGTQAGKTCCGGQCVSRPVPGQCRSCVDNDDCPEDDQVCCAGSCQLDSIPCECHDANDCQPGQRCCVQAKGPPGFCIPFFADCPNCVIDADCGDPLNCCCNNECQLCSQCTDEELTSGFCTTTVHLCSDLKTREAGKKIDPKAAE